MLHSFGPRDGVHPRSGFAADDKGNLHDLFRGASDHGVVFRLDGDGHESVVPAGDLFLAGDGTIYGTTEAGGEHASGTVFKLTLD